jgi:hypothetical protein
MLKQEEPHTREIKNKIETGLQQINKKQQEGFDEETKLKIQAYLDEIDRKQQQKIPYNKTKYIRFVFDRERKLLFFTGKFDKKEVHLLLLPCKYLN